MPKIKDSIARMAANKLMAWPLPYQFQPDGGITFDATCLPKDNWPTGTNLLTHQQAMEMFKACLPDNLELSPPSPQVDRKAILKSKPYRDLVLNDHWEGQQEHAVKFLWMCCCEAYWALHQDSKDSYGIVDTFRLIAGAYNGDISAERAAQVTAVVREFEIGELVRRYAELARPGLTKWELKALRRSVLSSIRKRDPLKRELGTPSVNSDDHDTKEPSHLSKLIPLNLFAPPNGVPSPVALQGMLLSLNTDAKDFAAEMFRQLTNIDIEGARILLFHHTESTCQDLTNKALSNPSLFNDLFIFVVRVQLFVVVTHEEDFLSLTTEDRSAVRQALMGLASSRPGPDIALELIDARQRSKGCWRSMTVIDFDGSSYKGILTKTSKKNSISGMDYHSATLPKAILRGRPV